MKSHVVKKGARHFAQRMHCFSTARLCVPETASSFFLNNPSLIIPQASHQEVAHTAKLFTHDLMHKHQGGCQDTGGFLHMLARFKNMNARVNALFLQGAQSYDFDRRHYLEMFTGVLSCMTGHVPQCEHNYHRVESDADAPDLAAHSDDIFITDKPPLTLLSLSGLDAKFKNHITYFMEIDDILEMLSPRSQSILEEKIFCYDFDLVTSEGLHSILEKQANGYCKISFAVDVLQNWSYDVSQAKINVKEAEALAAITELNDVIHECYRSGKVTPFALGDNDILLIKNEYGLHIRNQDGIAYQDLRRPRTVLAGSHTKEDNRPTEIITDVLEVEALMVKYMKEEKKSVQMGM